ncbi:hypothetical protein [Aliiroseovarius sediminis]|uniref:hypothetical protein n=1 Tax=Aliiroseovarius sediminis TaxID=2925839 RepID=UPI001F58D0CF|nr:hypothetical protein [Aliiroseovarius sediminis]MCI2394996.1 hypothetical protein [Aliiroseovarius sediminis]
MKPVSNNQPLGGVARILTRKTLPMVSAAALGCALNAGFAQTASPTTEDIPTFDDGAPFTQSDALGVSGDGSVVVGAATDSSFGRIAFSYAGGTLTNLAPLDTGNPSSAQGASADGAVIAGFNTISGLRTATYWTQSTGQVTIPTAPASASQANDVSGDGTAIVGTLFGDGVSPAPTGPGAPAAYNRAFVWNRTTNIVTTLSSLIPGGDMNGSDINDDGTIVVGRGATGTATHAYRAVVGGAVSDLGTLGSVAGNSRANGVSGDGLVVVGQSDAPATTGQRAFRWSAGTGMVQLNSTDDANVTFSLANAASADGAYVAGGALYSTTPGYRALRWDSTGTATDLGDLTSDNSGTSIANGITADGMVVVGNASNDDGNIRGFIWRDAVQPGGTMLDHINTLTQVADNAAQQAAGAAQLGQLVHFALDNSIELSRSQTQTRGKAPTRPPFSMRVVAGAANNPDANNGSVAAVMAAVGLGHDMSVGGHLGLGTDTDTLDGYGINGNFLSYGAYVQKGKRYGDGLSWKVAAAQSSAEVDISRSTVLPNTERGMGTTDLGARAASVELGYGMRRGDIVVAPFVRVARTVVQRDGYTEDNSVAFPVTYDDHDITATVATLGTNVRLPVSDAGVVKLSAGVEWDLSRSTDPVSGSSAIPGMTDFAIAGPSLEHDERLFAEARYVHTLSAGRSYDVGLGIQQTPYSDKPSLMAAIGFQMDF